MPRIFLLSCFLLFAVFSVSAQSKKKPKKWQIVVIGKQLRTRAFLQNVTDSSVVLVFGNGLTKEISFKTISKIKLKPRSYSGVAIGAASFFVGEIAGGIIVAALSKGKTGEPSDMVGMIAIGLTAAILTPLILGKLVSKKFYVHNDSVSYQSLKLRLKPYCLIQ